MWCKIKKSGWLVPLMVLMMAGCSSEPEVLTVAAFVSRAGAQKEPSSRVQRGIEAGAKWVNETHEGIEVDGKKYELELVFFDDNSDKTTVTSIAQEICSNPNIKHAWGPYSSGLTEAASEVLNGCGKMLVNAGAASDSIYTKGYANNIQLFSPGSGYHRGTLDMLVAKIAPSPSQKNVALLYEDEAFAQTTAVAADAHARQLGFNVVYSGKYPKSATIDTPDEDFRSKVEALKTVPGGVDILLGGGHTEDGRALTQFIAYAELTLDSASILVAPAAGDFYEKVGCESPCDGHGAHRGEGISTPSQWEPDATYSPESASSAGKTWFGPTIAEFSQSYESLSAGEDVVPTYHSASGAASILVFALAAERAKSIEPAAVFAAAQELEVTTLFGDFDIEASGLQSGHTMVEVQWQEGAKHVVWPVDASSRAFLSPLP